MSEADAAAPPLGHRPNEPMPGRESLADPQGRAAAAADADGAGRGDGGRDGDRGAGREGGGDGDSGVCPDCGLPYSDHPDYAADGQHGHRHGPPQESEGSLPGERLDPSNLGGDPAEP
jgi:hypothetical protein